MTRHVCWIAVLLVASASAVAVDRQHPTFRSHAEGVRIDVLASDGGRPLTRLTSNDFDVRDNGVPQNIETVEVTNGVNVAVVMDVSHSVLDGGIQPLLAASDAYFGCLRPSDAAALLTFSQGTRLIAPLSRDVDTVRRAVRDAARAAPRRLGDGTAMWDAVFAGASVVLGQRARPIVLLLTDAGDNASWVFPLEPGGASWVRKEREKSVAVLRGSGVIVDVVWLPRYFAVWSQYDSTYGAQSQTEPAELTGGRSFPASDPHLREKFAARLEQLRSGYVLTYRAAGVPQGDGWHKLTVRLKSRKGRVEARAGYFAGGAPR